MNKLLPARYATGLFVIFVSVCALLAIGCGGAGATTKQLTITTSSLPSGNEGRSYSANLTAANGQLPYNWSIDSGALPDGLSLDANGLISGLATKVGDFNFTARVVDGGGSSKVKALLIYIGLEMEVKAEITLVTSDWPTAADYDIAIRIEEVEESLRLSTSSQPIPTSLFVKKRADWVAEVNIWVKVVPPPSINNGVATERLIAARQQVNGLRTPTENNVTLDIWPGRPSPYLTTIRYRLSATDVP